MTLTNLTWFLRHLNDQNRGTIPMLSGKIEIDTHDVIGSPPLEAI